MAEESAVKVCVRVRPLIEREEAAATESIQPTQLYWKAEEKSIHLIDDGNLTKSFSFDRVFNAKETTNQLYQDIAKPLVVSSVEGYNGTIFAYGQTSSGKTFTMMGSNLTPGVIPLAMTEVFETIKTFPKKEFLLRVSYMEIYNETVTDLLVDSWTRKPLEVRESINKNIYVSGLTEELVTSPAQALAWIRKGEKNRHYGKTKMNERSSRSHTILRMILESRERSDPASGENADGAIIVSHLNLVDLAGSERASQTGAEGARFKEGCNINRSLLTLGQVIKKLSDESQRGFTNYRDSKLTRILQNSLGGNAKTVIICTVTPDAIDETLSTLQFASTAKNMKNDPHVTEVSDDGALLKRYRNEIVDLKRRLQEVSTITHNTVTERESLSQLLQEKDQLQREQEDRIKNLTKLLVTSSNFVPIKKNPKRRVTWGGKLLRFAESVDRDDGQSDLSFAEPICKKRRPDLFSLTELREDDEDFDSNWDLPDESTFNMEMNRNSGTIRSFEDSPSEVGSLDQMGELSDKVSHLELQLETETQQKQEAATKVETLDRRVEELTLQLETEAQQKQEAMEKAERLENRLAELERQLAEQAQTPTEADDQMIKKYAEAIQLCEALCSEKGTMAAERDYLNQELGIFMEQIKILEKEKTALSQELEERRELDEFKSLEEACKKEHEKELQNEISSLKENIKTYELKCQELEASLEAMSEELKKKSDWAEELQSLSDKDLAQQVKQLRRSLDDAEGLSRETKREWAFLRSENIVLKERDTELTARYEKMEAEVNSLHFQLEAEKSRFRKMQTDLQRELQVAFDENTKLTILMDGKVPKNLIDSVELERTVADLKKELATSREEEGTLRHQLEELNSLQGLPDKVDNLMKQVCELTEELCALQTQKDSLLSAQAHSEEQAQQFRDTLQISQDEIAKLKEELSNAELREQDLTQRCADATEQLDKLHSDLESSTSEKNQLLAAVEEMSLRLNETDQQRASFEEKLNEMQQLIKDLEERLADSELSRSTEEEIGKELQEQVNQLTQELESVRAERDGLLSEKTAETQNSAEELEKLLSEVTRLTEERDQLKIDLQENVEMTIENQEDLRAALEKNCKQEEKIKLLEHAQMSRQDRLTSEQNGLQLEELQNHIKQLTEELESVQAERDSLLSEKTAETQNSAEELEKLLSKVTCLTEERDQLQEMVEGLRQERNQLKEHLEENVETLNETDRQRASFEDKLKEMQQQMKDLEEKLTDSGLSRSTEEDFDKELKEQLSQLTEELESVRAERDCLLSEKTADTQNSAEELEKLLSKVTCLTEERDQLQEIVEGLRQERNQLKEHLEEKMEMAQMEQNQQLLNSELQAYGDQVSKAAETQDLSHTIQVELKEQMQMNSDLERLSQEKESHLQQIKTLIEDLESLRAERDGLLSVKTVDTQNSTEELEKLLSKVTCLTEERDQLQEIVEGLRQERNQLKAHLEENMEMAQTEQNQQQLLNSELQAHNEQVSLLQQQMDALNATLQTVTEQKKQLESDLQHNMEMAAETQGLLHSIQEELKEQNQMNSNLEKLSQEKESHLEQQIKTLTEELESVRADRDSLLSEKTADTQNSAEELEKLLSTLTCLTEERDQLQEIVEGLRQERNQLKERLEENMEMAQTEQNQQQLLNSELQAHNEQVSLLQQQMDALNATLQTVTEQKKQLESDLQHNMEMAAETQGLLHSIQEELKEQKQMNSDLERLSQEKESHLEQQIKTLTEELESVRADRDSLLSEKTADTQNSAEELEKLQSKVTCLTEERDQLQEIVEGLRQERNQLKAHLEENMETAQTEQNQQQLLNSELQAQNEQVSLLQQQLHAILQTVTEQKSQFESDLQCNMEMAAETQGLLHSIQEELKEQKQMNSDLERLSQEKESHLEQQIKTLTEELETVRAERNCLLSEKMSDTQNSAEELEKLLSKVTCLTEERDQLQEMVEGLRQERNQLKEHLEENVETVIQVQASLKQQQHLNSEQQVKREQQEDQFRKQVQQLEEELQELKGTQFHNKATIQASQQLLDEANMTISVLEDQLSSLEQRSSSVSKGTAGGLSSRLQDSTLQLQESFKRFYVFMECCSNYSLSPVDKALRVQQGLMYQHLTTLPKPTITAYRNVDKLTVQIDNTLGCMKRLLKCYALDYKLRFEELVQSDLAVFEERRLQDVLLSKAQAPSYSIKEEDFQAVWEPRLSELLDKRETYLQKMDNLLERLWGNMATYPSTLSEELRERERSNEELRVVCASQPLDLTRLDSILSCELDRRTAVAHSKKMALQGICDEHRGLTKELELLSDQAVAELSEEKSKTATLLQVLETAPVKTEVDLLKDNQQLVLQLQQSEREVMAIHMRIEQLEEEQINANNMVSNHKQATQLLQTELQDTCAQVHEKDRTIQTLKDKLRESEDHAKRNASPSAVELEELRAKVVKMEVKLTTATLKHEEEIQRMTTVLNHKEQSLRKLKETLRESQQQGEESFLQGKDLYARLTHPKGHTVQSSIHTEKTKLEEEVKQLKLKITELESLVSRQQTDIAKWKSRAIKLKEKGKVTLDKPLSPCTPTKRRLPMSSESSQFFGSPKRLLDSIKDSPKETSLLNSPKSKFFDVRPGSESLSHCPKQFFDNSKLGTVPDADADMDNMGHRWWPHSPKHPDACKTQ